MSRIQFRPAVEWPTLAVLAATYAVWMAVTSFAGTLGPWIAIPLLAVILAQHSSLQHEALHGHPFRNQRLNDALVFPALGLLVPYRRFRDTHLAHHHDPNLTDPYDDPESNYLDPAVDAPRPPGARAARGQQHAARPPRARPFHRHGLFCRG
jgi:fatty acid desaturase